MLHAMQNNALVEWKERERERERERESRVDPFILLFFSKGNTTDVKTTYHWLKRINNKLFRI